MAALLLMLGCLPQPQEGIAAPKPAHIAALYQKNKSTGSRQQKHLPPAGKQKHRAHQLKRPDLPATVWAKPVTITPSALVGMANTPRLPAAYLFVYSREIAPPPKAVPYA